MDVQLIERASLDLAKVLCICDTEYLLPFMRQKGVLAYSSYRSVSFFQRIIRRFFILLGLPMHYWYDNWKNQLPRVETVIVFAIRGGETIINYIMSKNKNIRLKLWYWDPVYRIYSPEQFDSLCCEKWSFDPTDCKSYQMKHNTGFYFNNIQIPHTNVTYDVCFVGYDKGRRKEIESIEHLLVKINCKTNFYIVDDDAAKRNYKGARPRKSYQQILEIVAGSKAILDVLQENQTGFTIRPMEALFFKKKLITTQLSIKGQDFYHPDNIFLLGIDDIESLPTFLHKPLHEIPKSVVDRYDFISWINRFA